MNIIAPIIKEDSSVAVPAVDNSHELVESEASGSSQFSSLIPVIDLSDFYDPERRAEFVQRLGKAFQNHGFVTVVNTRIDQSVLDRANQAVKEFFSQDLEIKRAIQSSTNSGERGYVTGETPKRQPRHVVDLKEILHIGRELSAEQQSKLRYPTIFGPRILI